MKEKLFDVIRYAASVLIVILCLVVPLNETVRLILYISSAVLSGYTVLIECFENVGRGNFFDENTLMLIASVVSFVLGEYFEGVAILVLFGIGELLEDVASDRARDKITALSELQENKVRLVGGRECDPKEVKIGTLIEVLKGERIALDGILVSGSAQLDLKAITGESRIYEVNENDEVYGGSINLGNPVVIKTTKEYSDSTVERIISLVEGANAKKAKTQKFITKFAKIYTPVVVLLAVLIAFMPTVLFGASLSEYVHKALSFLIVACPCALVISVPLGYFVGIGALSKKGVLIKGSSVIDALSKVNAVAFDKTGTLTKGELSVDKVVPYGEYEEREVLKLVSSVEKHSDHPIGRAFDGLFSDNELYEVFDFNEISGKGISCTVNGKPLLIGSSKLISGEAEKGTCVFVKSGETLIGKVLLSDTIKEDAKDGIAALKDCGVTDTYILSGDNKSAAAKVGNSVGIDKVYAELLPEQKLEALNRIKSEGKRVAFVGDGINDSPCIANADVGIAMGKIGSEVSIETADVVILTDSVKRVSDSVKHSKKIKKVVLENIIVSIGVKVAIMVTALVLTVPTWVSALGDVGVMLLAVLNSLRNGRIQ